MNWQSFKQTLLQNPDLELQFQYADGKLVDAAYHITEIKQAPITSVDCGGVMSAWTEIIVQLWVPDDEQQERSMQVSKALKIVDVVERMLPLNPNGIVKIEFGNSEFDTRQMFPNEIIIQGETLLVDLRPDAVQCKATGRGAKCGVPVDASTKQKIQMVNLISADTSCTPGNNCC